MTMNNDTLTRLFVGSLIAIAGGLVLLGVAGGMAYANGSFVINGPDVVGVRATPPGWAMIGLAALAGLALVAAVIVQLAAWIAAVIASPTW
jgi:hypothetical protein